MNVLKLIVAGAGLATALPAAATVITFDALPSGAALPTSGTTITDQYASLGVTFLGTNTATGATGPLNAWGLLAATGPGGSRNYLGNFGAIPASQVPGPSDYLLAPRWDLVSISFSGLASGVSFGLYTGGGQNSVAISAYDASGALLQSLPSVMANNGQFDIQSLTAANIARIDILAGRFSLPNGTIKLYGIDNLTFTLAATPAVPEPASWAMMIAGFGLVGAALRRRNVSIAFAG
jgi:hypothetical protein